MRRSGNGRIIALALGVVLVGGVIGTRLFFIQVKEHAFYEAIVASQHEGSEKLLPERGSIYIRDLSKNSPNDKETLHPVAINKNGYFAYAVPRDIPKDRVEDIAVRVADTLSMDREIVLARIGKKADPYEPLKNRLSDAEVTALTTMNIPGINLAPERWRLYPERDLVPHLTGFLGAGASGTKGMYGIERQFESILRGEEGFRTADRDAFGRLLSFRIREESPQRNGSDIVLTVDANIQYAARNILRTTLKKWESPGGLVLVLEPSTGRILALAAEPTYDPNAYGDVKDSALFMNPAIERIFEPGSVFKPITMSSALNEKLVTPNSTYTDDGVVRIGGYAIRNFDDKAYGIRTMTEVIMYSLNTGAVYAERLLGRDRFQAYVQNFGFGEKLGVDLPGELKGSTANLRQKAEVNFATASFGQGLSVTPLQMAASVAAIANGGTLMQPYVVEKILNADGLEKVTVPREIRRVLTPEASRAMSRIMVEAARGKFEHRADVPGYFVAAKTGTAQIPDPATGGYMPVTEGVIHSFVGFAPAFNPRFLIFFKMDRPTGVQFASNSLTEPFHNLAVYLLNYLNIPPDEPEKVKGK